MVCSRSSIIVALLWSAPISSRGVQLKQPQSIGSARPCDETELLRTHSLLRAKNYDDLLDSPCIPAERLEAIKDGQAHPHDAWEFMRSATEFNCTNVGEFDFPGDCQQLPHSTCIKNQLPSFLYLGTPHAGSSSLAWQLNEHPELSYGMVKEHMFFTTPSKEWRTPYSGETCCSGRNELCTCRQRETFKSEFPVPCHVKQTFDATPSTLYLGDPNQNCTSDLTETSCAVNYHWRLPGPSAIEDVKTMLGPDLKLIMMFRDPVDIMVSKYGEHGDQLGVMESHLDAGTGLCFADAVEGWMSVFGKENLLFINSLDYFADPQSVLDKVLMFLDVSPKVYTEKELKAYGRRRSTSSVDTTALRKKFHSKLHNKRCQQRLEEITGLKFTWDKIEA